MDQKVTLGNLVIRGNLDCSGLLVWKDNFCLGWAKVLSFIILSALVAKPRIMLLSSKFSYTFEFFYL